MDEQSQKAQVERKEEKTERFKIALWTAIITAISAVIVALIYVLVPDIQERLKKEAEKQDELESVLKGEELVLLAREWETHAGIKYMNYTIGTQSEKVQFRIRPYFFIL